jgi:predicted transcriptional regulator
MKYRSRSDIIGLILAAANGGATKTRIMYSAFLSFEQLKQYVALLLEKGLIEYEEITHKFRTTEKGMRVLKIQNQINDEFIPVMTEGRQGPRIDQDRNW